MARHHAGQIVLACLGCSDTARGNLLDAQILGVEAQELFPYGGKFAQGIIKDHTVRGNCQIVLRYGTPFAKGFGAGRHIEKTPVEALYGHGAYAAHALLRLHADPEALEAFRKPGKSLLYALGIGNQDILWQPQAKGRAPVVITGDVVVKAEALRALAHKACGNLAFEICKLAGYECFAALLIEFSG